MKTILPLVFSLALFGSTAMAAITNAPVTELTPEHFAHLDKDNSGGISRAEYDQFMRDTHKQLDTDGNNSLSRAETSKVLTPGQFDAIDADKNGELSLDELIAQVMHDFDRQDTNKDGILQP